MIKRFKKTLATSLLGLGLALALPEPARAQSPFAPKYYPLTNANTFTIATGGTNMAAAALTLINSVPFPVWRGRGFAYQLEVVGTNANANNVTPFFQFATPITNGSTLTTNWSQYVPGTPLKANGTTTVFQYAVVPPTTVDNCTIGRLAVVSNAHDASTLIRSTNTFVSVVP